MGAHGKFWPCVPELSGVPSAKVIGPWTSQLLFLHIGHAWTVHALLRCLMIRSMVFASSATRRSYRGRARDTICLGASSRLDQALVTWERVSSAVQAGRRRVEAIHLSAGACMVEAAQRHLAQR